MLLVFYYFFFFLSKTGPIDNTLKSRRDAFRFPRTFAKSDDKNTIRRATNVYGFFFLACRRVIVFGREDCVRVSHIILWFSVIVPRFPDD